MQVSTMSAVLTDFRKYIFHIDWNSQGMNSKRFVVDRTENGIIVLCGLDDDIHIEASVNSVGKEFSDGDFVIVSFNDDGTVSGIIADKLSTESRRKDMKKKLKSLFDN